MKTKLIATLFLGVSSATTRGSTISADNTLSNYDSQAHAHRSSSEATINPSSTWDFIASMGNQDFSSKGDQFSAWVASISELVVLSSVSLPSVVWLFLTGLIGLLSLKRGVI